MARQEQSSGDNANNYQSAGPLTVNNNFSGISAEALKILDHLIEKEVRRYTDAALVEAQKRYEAIYTEVIRRIAEFDEERLRSLGDPGVQADVLAAGDAYARSGREDVKDSLVDLIALRCGVEASSLQGAAISQAIETVRKITISGISILTVAFLVGRVKGGGITSLATLESWATSNIEPFLSSLSSNEAEYEYLASTPAAYSAVTEIGGTSLLPQVYPGLFNVGFDPEVASPAIGDLVKTRPQLFIECLHDSERLQPSVLDLDTADERLEAEGIDESGKSEYKSLLTSGILPTEKVATVLADNCPTWSRVLTFWDQTSQIRSLRLTSVGIAIAHCNWTSKSGAPTPLSVWIPD